METQVEDAELLWSAASESLRAQVSDAVWMTCFHSARAVSCDGDELILAVPSAMFKDRIEQRYLGLVEGALADAGAPDATVRIEVQVTPSVDEVEELPAAAPVTPVDDPIDHAEPRQGAVAAPVTAGGGTTPQINTRYTFDAFITGPSNRFAHAAALAVAETPARNYNPLFIYGGPGLGKTHLLQAIGHYVDENYPTYTVRYVTTEQFLNQFVDAIRAGAMADFKKRYRELDVFLLDDIQFIEKSEQLQEELFHTFDHLHQANSQIVFTCDRPPDAIATLEDRLRSRFRMGLITEISPPDLETRLAILRKKAEREHPTPPADVLEFIATHVTNNIRELEGSLIRVCAYASLTKEPLSVELAERVLSDLISDNQPRPITADLIIDTTAEMFGCTTEELRGRRRTQPLVTSRQISMYVVRELTDMSYPAIAREFGGRDHTTVIHAVEKITALMPKDRAIFDKVTALSQAVRSGS